VQYTGKILKAAASKKHPVSISVTVYRKGNLRRTSLWRTRYGVGIKTSKNLKKREEIPNPPALLKRYGREKLKN
jgi:hypothetical protein